MRRSTRSLTAASLLVLHPPETASEQECVRAGWRHCGASVTGGTSALKHKPRPHLCCPLGCCWPLGAALAVAEEGLVAIGELKGALCAVEPGTGLWMDGQRDKCGAGSQHPHLLVFIWGLGGCWLRPASPAPCIPASGILRCPSSLSILRPASCIPQCPESCRAGRLMALSPPPSLQTTEGKHQDKCFGTQTMQD